MIKLVSSEAQGIVICGGDFNVRLCQIFDTSKSYISGEHQEYQISDRAAGTLRRLERFTKRDYFLKFQRDLYRVTNGEIDDR